MLAPAWAKDKQTAETPTDAFSATQIAQGLLKQIGEGLRAYNSRQMLAAFDRDGMPGYLTFQDQVECIFCAI